MRWFLFYWKSIKRSLNWMWKKSSWTFFLPTSRESASFIFLQIAFHFICVFWCLWHFREKIFDKTDCPWPENPKFYSYFFSTYIYIYIYKRICYSITRNVLLSFCNRQRSKRRGVNAKSVTLIKSIAWAFQGKKKWERGREKEKEKVTWTRKREI